MLKVGLCCALWFTGIFYIIVTFNLSRLLHTQSGADIRGLKFYIPPVFNAYQSQPLISIIITNIHVIQYFNCRTYCIVWVKVLII